MVNIMGFELDLVVDTDNDLCIRAHVANPEMGMDCLELIKLRNIHRSRYNKDDFGDALVKWYRRNASISVYLRSRREAKKTNGEGKAEVREPLADGGQ